MDTENTSSSDIKAQDLALVSTAESVLDCAVIDKDASKLLEMGYRPQMRREFNTLQLISAAYMTTASWLGVVGGFAAGIIVGGPATLVYGLIIVAVFNIFIVTALAELVSAMPSAGGQYFWALQLAPKKIARVSAFATGICNLVTGICAAGGSCVLIGYFIMGSVRLYHPDLEIKPWQVYLTGISFYCGCAILSLHQKIVARTFVIGLVVSLIPFAVILIVPPAVSPSHTSAEFIFTNTENFSGWSSYGISFIVGLVNANYCFGIIDSAIHLAEEVPNPEINVPKALYTTVAIGFLTAWPLAIVFMYVLTDFEAVVETPTLVPLLQFFLIALRNNRPGAITLLMLILVCGVFAMIGLQTYMARICWSFSRDKGLPFHRHLTTVHAKLGVPVAAHILCVTMICIVTLLCVASSTAFNSLASGLIVFPSISYTIPIIYSLLPSNKHIKGPFHTGLFGTFSKIATIVFCIFTSVFYSFPFLMPVTASNMNYLSAIIGVVAIYGIIDWFLRARKDFRGVDE